MPARVRGRLGLAAGATYLLATGAVWQTERVGAVVIARAMK
jgi:hypothetical protein